MTHFQTKMKCCSTPSIYSEEERARLATAPLPKHIAIVMDGNRRWEEREGRAKGVGHWYGAEQLDPLLRASIELGIETLTLYAFSTENWGRCDREVELLMNLFENYLLTKREQLVKEGVALHSIGDTSRFPEGVQRALMQAKEATKACKNIHLVLAMSYGGRDEMRRAILKMATDEKRGRLKWEELSEERISTYLDTAPFCDPDLFIRPSGECRISNFLNWQIAYSEIYFTEVLWPDFSERDLLKAIFAYQQRGRRFGT